MKPWLLNILACPIDKHHPMEARFFTWETSEEEMRKINSEAGKPNQHFRKSYQHLAKQIADGTISSPSVRAVRDLSGSNDSAELLADSVKAVNRFEMVENPDEKKLLQEFPEGIDVLYRFLNLLEVEEGLLVCPECGRWYPIGSAVETIPELLPDDLREKERDLAWLEKWRGLVPQEVLERGKPFNISG